MQLKSTKFQFTTYSVTRGIEKTWLAKSVMTDGYKICNFDAVLCHINRLTLRVEYTKLHYYKLRIMHVTVWKNNTKGVESTFVQILEKN